MEKRHVLTGKKEDGIKNAGRENMEDCSPLVKRASSWKRLAQDRGGGEGCILEKRSRRERLEVCPTGLIVLAINCGVDDDGQEDRHTIIQLEPLCRHLLNVLSRGAASNEGHFFWIECHL